MAHTKRLVGRYVAVALLVSVVLTVVALVVLQTPWAKDRVRAYAERQASQYLMGELSIGRLSGNLFTGVVLDDVRLTQDGRDVVRADRVEVSYGIPDLLGSDRSLDALRLVRPVVVAEERPTGWNLAEITVPEETPAEPQPEEEATGRFAIDALEVVDGVLLIDSPAAAMPAADQPAPQAAVPPAASAPGQPVDPPAASAPGQPVDPQATAQGDLPPYRLPARVDALNALLALRFGPEGMRIDIDRFQATATRPDLRVTSLSGVLEFGDQGATVEGLSLTTARTRLEADARYDTSREPGDVQATLRALPLDLTELSPFVPALEGRALAPRIDLMASGPLDAVAVTGSIETDDAGSVRADLRLDVDGPAQAAAGSLEVLSLNPAPLLADDTLAGDLSATIALDLQANGSWAVENLSGDVNVRGTDLRLSGYLADAVDATARLDGRNIGVRADVQAYGTAASANGQIDVDENAVGYDLQGRIAGLDLRALPPDLGAPSMATDVTATFDVQGRQGETVSGSLTFEPSSVAGASLAGGSRASGTYRPDGPPSFAFTGQVAALDLQRIGQALEIEALAAPRFASNLNADLEVEGSGASLEALEATASATLSASTLFDAQVPELRLDATVADEQLHLTTAGRVEGLDPARAAGDPRVAGVVNGRFDITADVTDLADMAEGVDPAAVEASGTVELTGSRVGELALESVRLDASYANEVAQVRELTVMGPTLEVTASGPVMLAGTGESALEFDLGAFRLDDFEPFVGRDLGGSVIAAGTIRGNRGTLRADGTLQVAALQVDDVLDVLSGMATYDARVTDLNPDTVTADVTFESTLLTVAGRELRSAEATVQYAYPNVRFDASASDEGRTAEVAGLVVLHPEAQAITVDRFAFGSADTTWTNPEGRTLSLEYGGGLLRLDDVRLVDGDQAIVADGVLALDETTTSSLGVQIQNVDLASLGSVLLLERQLGGRLDAEARVTGTGADRVAEGMLSVADGVVDEFRYTSLDGTFDYRGPQVQLDATLVPQPGASLQIDGAVPTTADGAIDVRITSTPITLAVAAAATASLEEVTGELQVDVQVSGTAEAPLANGAVTVRNGAFTVVPTGVSYERFNAAILLNGTSAAIDQFEMADGGGDMLQVTGQLMTEGRSISGLSLMAEAADFEVLGNELGDVSLNATVGVEGTVQALDVNGTMRVRSGRLEVDAILAQLTTNPYPTDETAPEEPTASPLEALTLQVEVEVPDNLVLRGTDIRAGADGAALGDMNVTVGGTFNIRKPAGEEVVLLGAVNVVRGTYDFQGRRFTVQRDGTIRFEGTEEINPALNLRADREISGIVAHVNVGGTVREPTIALSSDPPLDEADILSLIVFNQPANQLGEGERVSLGERATSLASGLVVSPIAESIGRALDLDLFEVETVGEEGGGPTVTLGNQVGERTFLRFRQQFGAQDVSEFMLEYRLAEFLRLEGSIAEGQGRANRSFTRRVERGGIDLVVFFSY
ncbi:MAG: translocation/assembly module TamB domain-containing protein [Vicinamibacterales bacterium]